MSQEPSLNQIVFIDLSWRTKPYLIIRITKFEEEGKIFFRLHLLPISSQDESEIKVEERLFVSRRKIHQLPNCLKNDPSFIRINCHVDLKITKSDLIKYLCKNCPWGCFKEYKNSKNELVNEYDFLVKCYEDYINDKVNELRLKKYPHSKIEIEGKKKKIIK